MTCLTCHEEATAGPHAAADDDFLRRGPGGVFTCAECHDARTQPTHAGVLGIAHLRRHDSGAGSADRLESVGCLGCHDGTVAGDAASHRVRAGYQPDADHPVGVRYRAGPSRGRDEAPLHPASSLDQRIRLFDGTVGCGSCHSLYSPLPGRLVMDNQGSRLCLECHAY